MGEKEGKEGKEDKKDYLDKGLEAAQKKLFKGKVDPEKNRKMNEKITDGARSAFTKFTGIKVPSKISN